MVAINAVAEVGALLEPPRRRQQPAAHRGSIETIFPPRLRLLLMHTLQFPFVNENKKTSSTEIDAQHLILGSLTFARDARTTNSGKMIFTRRFSDVDNEKHFTWRFFRSFH